MTSDAVGSSCEKRPGPPWSGSFVRFTRLNNEESLLHFGLLLGWRRRSGRFFIGLLGRSRRWSGSRRSSSRCTGRAARSLGLAARRSRLLTAALSNRLATLHFGWLAAFDFDWLAAVFRLSGHGQEQSGTSDQAPQCSLHEIVSQFWLSLRDRVTTFLAKPSDLRLSTEDLLRFVRHLLQRRHDGS